MLFFIGSVVVFDANDQDTLVFVCFILLGIKTFLIHKYFILLCYFIIKIFQTLINIYLLFFKK